MAMLYQQSHFQAMLWSAGRVVGVPPTCAHNLGIVLESWDTQRLSSPDGLTSKRIVMRTVRVLSLPSKIMVSLLMGGGGCAVPTTCAHIGQVLADQSSSSQHTPDDLLTVIKGDGNVTFQQHYGQLLGVLPTSDHIGEVLAITFQHQSS